MSDLLIGELLCLGLIIILCGRVLFLKREKVVYIAILAPISFVIALLQITAWGITPMEGAILILSLLVFIANINAIARFASHLYVDHYNPVFFAFSLTAMAAAIGLSVIAIYFRPVKVLPKNYNVTLSRQILTGTVKEGIKIKSSISQKADGILWTFAPDSSIPAKKTVLLFSADKKADTTRYMPYLILLAHAGYTVLAADIYPPDVRWLSPKLDLSISRRFALLFLNAKKNERYTVLSSTFTENITEEYDMLILTGTEKYGAHTKFFLIGDTMSSKALETICQKYPFQISGSLQLEKIPEYKTPGFGCIEQTDPLLCSFLHGPQRDPTLFIPRYMALKTAKAVEAAGGAR